MLGPCWGAWQQHGKAPRLLYLGAFGAMLGPCWAKNRVCIWAWAPRPKCTHRFWVMSGPCWAYVGFMLVYLRGLSFIFIFTLLLLTRAQENFGNDSRTRLHGEFKNICSLYFLSMTFPNFLSIHHDQCIYLSIYLSTDLIYLSIYLSTDLIYLSIYLPIYLSTYLPIYLSICLSIYLSICLSVCPSVCLSVYLPVCVYLSVCLSVYLYICLSVDKNVGMQIFRTDGCMGASFVPWTDG